MTLSTGDRQARVAAEREGLTARLFVACPAATRDVAVSEVHRRAAIFREINISTVRTVGDPMVAALRSVLDDIMAGRL